MTGKCHCTPTALQTGALFTAHNGGQQHCQLPLQGPQLLGISASRDPPPQDPTQRTPPDLPVLGSYMSPSLTSTLLKRTTPPSLGKGFWVSPAEKDTGEGAGTPGTERTECSQAGGVGAWKTRPVCLSREAALLLYFAFKR